MRLLQIALTVAVIILCVAPSARAERIGRGNSLIWVGLNGGRAQLITSPLAIQDGDEVGVHGAYSHFLSDAWTIVASGGLEAGRQRIETGFVPPFKYASHSWNVRLGFDRYAFINDDVALYAGPGLLYWMGHAEIPDGGFGVSHMPDVHQVAFNGRLGMLARLSGHVGLFGHIGQVIGSNSSDEGGVKTTWWSSSHEGSVGLSLDF
jgi:hypothetical protein